MEKKLTYQISLDERLWDISENSITDFICYVKKDELQNYLNEISQIIKEQCSDILNNTQLIKSYDLSIKDNDFILTIIPTENADENIINENILNINYLDNINGFKFLDETKIKDSQLTDEEKIDYLINVEGYNEDDDIDPSDCEYDYKWNFEDVGIYVIVEMI